jgi:dihydrofolate synthase/folylpolyglutamate synthase
MLKDKDVDGVIAAVKGEVDEWFVSGIAAERGGDSGFIRNALARAGVIETVSSYDSVAAAYAAACDKAGQNARIVVFGSFHTVAAVVAAR